MDIKHFCLFASAAITLGACATPRVPSNPDLANWASKYGYAPYTYRGQKVYCHGSAGFSGTYCVPAREVAILMAKNEPPPTLRYIPNFVPSSTF